MKFINFELDELFLTEAFQLSNQVDLISFDIFDTALTRCFDSPVDVFAEVERRLIELFGGKAIGFAMAREQAERDARVKYHQIRGAEEICLDDIYQEIPLWLPKFSEWAYAKQCELDCERDSLFAVPDILELTRRLHHAGIPYIFVSDMYLPSVFLAEVLSASGFEGWENIFVSSETQYTKATGSIWDVVGLHHNSSILHIGDDDHSDVLTPRKKGILTLEYVRARSERRVGAKLDPALLPFSRMSRYLELSSRSSITLLSDQQEAWRNLGRSLGGIVVGTFVKWLAERVVLHKIDRLYFCARDGFLIKKAWDAAGFDKSIKVETHYLYVSRATLNLAAGVANSSPQKLDQGLLCFLSTSAGKTTVRDAFDRAGLTTIERLVDEAKEVFQAGLDQVLYGPVLMGEFECLLQRYATEVFSILSPRFEMTIKYLRQEGVLQAGRQAMVDLGWHGSMQKALRQIVRTGGGSSQLFGFYYGLWPAANGKRYAAGLMESCFASDFLPWAEQGEVHQAVALLEQMHSASHGTTIGYWESSDGVVHPLLQESSAEKRQHESMTRFFQEGAIETLSVLFDAGRPPLISATELTKDAAIAALGAVFLSPATRELDLLSGVGHCATFDHSTHDPIIVETMPSHLTTATNLLLHSDWRLGQLKRWWLAGDVEQKNFLRVFGQTHLAHLGERVLRQFN